MNANVKLWIDALRSGKYTQGKYGLHVHQPDLPDAWCCLGIACDVYQREVGDLDIRDTLVDVQYDAHSVTLPDKVRKWLGLNDTAGRYVAFGRYGALTTDNDNGKTFEEIAATIEAEPEGLFA